MTEKLTKEHVERAAHLFAETARRGARQYLLEHKIDPRLYEQELGQKLKPLLLVIMDEEIFEWNGSNKTAAQIRAKDAHVHKRLGDAGRKIAEEIVDRVKK